MFCCDISEIHAEDLSQDTDLGGNLLPKPFFFFLIPPKASAGKAAKTNVCFMEKPSPVCVMGLVMMLPWPGACQGTPQPYCCTQGASMSKLCLEVGFWAGGEMLSWTLRLAQVLL